LCLEKHNWAVEIQLITYIYPNRRGEQEPLEKKVIKAAYIFPLTRTIDFFSCWLAFSEGEVYTHTLIINSVSKKRIKGGDTILKKKILV
jgi:hypothetical protein